MAGVTRNPNFVMPHVRAYNSANLTITNGTFTAVTLDSERWDTGTATEQHSTSSNTDRLTCRRTGLYSITASFQWTANITGDRILSIRLNGSSSDEIGRDRSAPASATEITCQSVNTQWRLADGDYVSAYVYQESGGSLASQVGSGKYGIEFSMAYLSA
jgi:hypothetical protein